MKTAKERVDEVKQYGYNLDIGETFNLAFEIYKKIALNAGVVLILFAIIMVALFVTLFGVIFGFSTISASMMDFDFNNLSGLYVVIYIFSMAAIAGVTYPFTAGLIKMAHNAHTKDEFSIGTAFDYFKGRYFGELFIAGFVLALFIGGITTALEMLYIPLLGGVLNLIISVFTILTIPLIIFSDLKALDAIGASFAITAKSFLWILLLMIAAVALALFGFFGFCIGIFFTLPFVYAMYYSIYANSVGIADKSEIDEIGSKWE